MPEGTDSAVALQTAVARLLRKRGDEALAYVGRNSGTTLTVADGWCVWQVYARTKAGVPSGLTDIGRHVRVPAQVLAPAFAAAREHGLLVGDDDALAITDVAHEELRKVAAAVREWLAIELADWKQTDDDDLKAALEGVARQFVDRDPEVMGSRPPALAH